MTVITMTSTHVITYLNFFFWCLGIIYCRQIMLVPCLSIFFLFIATIPNCFPSLIRNLSIIQSSIFNLCLPLALFPPISASQMFFSIPPSLLSTCPTKFHCLLLIVFKSCLSTPTFPALLHYSVCLSMISSSSFSKTTSLPPYAFAPYLY